MAAGVVGSAIIFGFAHASYASWPPYSRGVEIFLDACFWAVLFLQFGLLVTVIAHFLYDAVLFGIFAASGHAAIYHVTAGIILAALLAPAFAVLWRMIRQRGLVAAPEDARFAAWRPVAREERPRQARAREAGILTRRAHRLALAAAAIGVLAALGIPPEPSLGPEFTVERGRILATADSMLRGRGGNPRGWTRLSATTTNPDKSWSRFLRENGIEDQAGQLASSYAPAAWWTVRYVHTRGSTAQRDEEWQARVSPDGKPLGLRHVIPDSAGRATSDPATVRQVALTALARSGLDTARLEEVEYQETPRPARRDVTVTYTDTTVKLPEGAAARARVEIAGQEPLLVGRRVELPETFLRSDRQRQTTRLMIGAVGGMLLVVLLIAGAIIVRNRLPSALHDGPLDRRARLLLVVALALLAILNGLNSLPAQLSSYDTAQPWSTFLSRIGLGFVGPVVSSLLLLGMLLVVDALRRRVGIPMLPDGLRARPADVLVAGLGIGGIAYAAMHLHTLILRSDIPSPPSTSLDNAIPWLSGIFGIPAETIAAVMLLGIPVLVVAGLTARWSWRALLGAVILILVAIVWANSPAGDADPTGLALLIGGIVLLVAATVAWGGGSAWSWIIAALFFQMLGALPQAVYGPEWQTRTAAVLAALAAVGLIGLILRQAMNRHLQGSVA
jgi:hypothetical protein